MLGIPSPFLMLGGAALAVVIVGGAYLKGEHAGEARIEARVRAEVLVEQERQKTEADKALEAARQQDAEREKEIGELQEKVDAYEKSLAGGAACPLTDGDIERLQLIR